MVSLFLALSLSSAVELSIGAGSVTKTYLGGPEFGLAYGVGPQAGVKWKPSDELWLSLDGSFAPLVFGVAAIPNFAFYPTFDSVILRLASMPLRVTGGTSIRLAPIATLDLGAGVWSDYVAPTLGPGAFFFGLGTTASLKLALWQDAGLRWSTEFLATGVPAAHAELVTSIAFTYTLQ